MRNRACVKDKKGGKKRIEKSTGVEKELYRFITQLYRYPWSLGDITRKNLQWLHNKVAGAMSTAYESICYWLEKACHLALYTRLVAKATSRTHSLV